MKDYLKKLLPENRSVSILDIGCGDGWVLQSLKEEGYHNCIGIDIDRKAIDACIKKEITNVEVIDDIAEYLLGKEGCFDVINMREVLYYFPEDKIVEYLKAIYCSLKPNGILIVEIFNGALLTGDFFKYKDYKIKFVFTEHSLKKILEDANFEILHLLGVKMRCHTLKRFLWLGFRAIWILVLRAIYALEIGIGFERPTIWSKLIVAVAVKK